MSLLTIENLQVSFRTEHGTVRAVNGVDLSVDRGQVLGLVGESGSGKSVTNLAVLQLIPRPPGSFDGGRILFDGTDLLTWSERQMRSVRGNRISMIFQDPMTSLNPFLTVSRQITEVLTLHEGLSMDKARRRGIEMLERVGIPDPAARFDQYPHQFSGGMRQRVMIAIALACKPDLLLADEPTTALDVTIQAQILDLMRDLAKEEGAAVILVTHDLGVVAGIADDVAVMYGGRIVEKAPVVPLFQNPGHPYTQGLLASVPRLDSRKRLTPISGQPPDLTQLPPGCAFAPRCHVAEARCSEQPPWVGEARRGSRCWLSEAS